MSSNSLSSSHPLSLTLLEVKFFIRSYSFLGSILVDEFPSPSPPTPKQKNKNGLKALFPLACRAKTQRPEIDRVCLVFRSGVKKLDSAPRSVIMVLMGFLCDRRQDSGTFICPAYSARDRAYNYPTSLEK